MNEKFNGHLWFFFMGYYTAMWEYKYQEEGLMDINGGED